MPQLGALAVSRWSRLLHGDRRIETALSLEALANDVAFIAGPVAASTAVAVLAGVGGLGIACALVVGAALALAMQRGTMPVPGKGSGDGRFGRLVLFLGLANVLLGLLFGTTQLAVTALARGGGAVGLAGVHYLAMSVGSLVASGLYGLVRWSVPRWGRLVGAAGLVAAGGAALVAVRHPGAAMAALFVVGLGVGPVIIVSGTLVERHVGAGRLTQAFALMSALSAGGIALAGIAGGGAVQAHGPVGGFALVAGCGVALAAVGVAVRAAGGR